MVKTLFVIILFSIYAGTYSQERISGEFLSDSSLTHASVSLCVADAESEEIIMEYNSGKSLTPASLMKLVTSAAALELMGPQYTFNTIVGYTGSINKLTGELTGDIIIKGGGDPALGSGHFPHHYHNFQDKWVREIKKLGIKKIEGRIITDDSYYDYQPIPAGWLWEDAGNYYGAGVYGLSVFDNTYEIHLNTSSDSPIPVIIDIIPGEYRVEFANWLSASGNSDEGYVFAAPYSTKGWLAGTIPANMDDFILKASITDPPLLIAVMINDKLEKEGIAISKEPSTFRIEQIKPVEEVITITENISPPLAEIIEVLNHESVNLYAEHLIKELGRIYKGTGSTEAGTEVLSDFLNEAGIKTDGMFIEDGSGLSPLDAINTKELVNLLIYMKKRGKYFPEYYSSLPEAGKEGTLKKYFRDPVFNSGVRLKSGSMTRVRGYAGYITTKSDKELAFGIIINNYSYTSTNVIDGIERIIRELILNN